jgi:glycosyltransferase involved in cell wall biosynthesis
MKVSVIVPIYNKARYLERCVQSILAQSFSDFEVILVDDGSTDESWDVATAFADHRIRILHQQNKGPGSARNLGITVAHGSICAFLDADDAWVPNYLGESVELLESNSSVAAVVSGYFEFPGGFSTEEYWRRRGISEGIVSLNPSHLPTHLVALLAYMSSWSTVARKDALLRWGGFYDQNRCTYAEDSFLWLKVLLNEKVFFSTKPRAHFHREASQLSNTRSGPRPVEPFLAHPELIRKACPEKLSYLLEDFLAIRAFKTSCMLGYWGEWRRAQRLFLNFARIKHWRLPLFIPAVALTNPVGAAFAGAIRRVAR